MKLYYQKQTMRCRKCGCEVVWDEQDINDFSNYRGVWDKVDYHIENDPMCSREVKLRELLGEDFEEVLPIAHIEGSINIISK